MDVEQGLLEEGEASSLVARLHESLNVSGMAAAERIQRRRADQDTALPDADRSYDGAARVADVHKVSARTRTILRPFRSTPNHRAQNQIVVFEGCWIGMYTWVRTTSSSMLELCVYQPSISGNKFSTIIPYLATHSVMAAFAFSKS